MKQVFLDMETKRSFNQVGGYKPAKLGVSFVGVIERLDEDGEQKLEFFEEDLVKLWPVLEQADVVVGFNIIGFDLPVLEPYYAGKLNNLPVVDILERIERSVGHRVSLDAVANETLGVQKSGSGIDALGYYARGELDKLAKYCLKDVEITRDVYDFGKENGVVKFKNKWNRLIEAKVDFELTYGDGNGMQMTLGGV